LRIPLGAIPKKGETMAKKQLVGRSTAKKRKKKDVAAKKPRQGRLPGMEDSAIKDLEDAAIEHSELQAQMVADRAEMRDKLKVIDARIMQLMRENNKKTYNRAGIALKLKDEATVSVRVKRHEKKDSSEAKAAD
jgi:hypothetical protein